MAKFLTIMDLATARLGRDARTGADFAEAGFDIMGGCARCAASIAAYNAYPSTSGYWKCADCIGDDGFRTLKGFDGWCAEQEAASAEDESGECAGCRADDDDPNAYCHGGDCVNNTGPSGARAE